MYRESLCLSKLNGGERVGIELSVLFGESGANQSAGLAVILAPTPPSCAAARPETLEHKQQTNAHDKAY
jgi:hypothetical protein